MELINDGGERRWYFITEFITDAGLRARIHKCEWNKNISTSLHDFYTGYVQIPEGDTRDFYQDGNINVHGGVTFQGTPPDAPGKWVGFDFAHLGDEKIENQLEYCREECEYLAKQIAPQKNIL